MSTPSLQESTCPGFQCVVGLPNNNEAIQAVVEAELQSVIVVDLHTHLLLPPQAPLRLCGIDELLT
eukprot:scaffold11420_cov80-Cylindrotheca_fusiformis.AAC.2